jgi:hypothetical protein
VIPVRRKSVLALLGCAALAAGLVPLYALAAPNPNFAPDLRADPVENVVGPSVYLAPIGGINVSNRLLVRFDGFVTNVGNGPLEIRGNPQLPQTDDLGAKQYARVVPGPAMPTEIVGSPEVKYEEADGHDHFHLMRAMRYSLWNVDKTQEVAPGQKVGFCLYDLQAAPAPSPPAAPVLYDNDLTLFCNSGNPDATTLRMGVSSGRRDVYGAHLAFQWIDVSRTVPGTYLVGSQADPDNTIWEGGGAGPETNLRAFSVEHINRDQRRQVVVPGYLAKPVTTKQTGAPQAITLASDTVGTPNPVQYLITDGPTRGTLGPIVSGVVTYTPEAGYVGPDSFTYAARDSVSEFPTAGFEPTATVFINDATPSIAISGAPASLIAGTSAQLSATVANASAGVTWSVSAGSISPGGLFVAPAAPPASGTVTVRATSTAIGNLSSAVTIAIAPVPVAAPAPLPRSLPPPATTNSTTPRKLLSRMVLARAGRRDLVATLSTGRRAGRITVTMTDGRGKVLGRCGARVSANRTVSCKLTIPHGTSLAKVRATATLAFGGQVFAVRRAALTPRRAGG